MLRDHVALATIRSYDWQTLIVFPPYILHGNFFQSRNYLSLRFMEAVLDRLEIPLTDSLIPLSFVCDMCGFRIEGEREYVDCLLSWTQEILCVRLLRNASRAPSPAQRGGSENPDVSLIFFPWPTTMRERCK